MKRKIKKRITKLWERIEFEMEKFREKSECLEKHIKERKIDTAYIDACFALVHLRDIKDALNIMIEFERLLEKKGNENERK